MDLYTENILDHNEHPCHYGLLPDATITAEDNNPLCGDKIKMQLKFDHNTLVNIAFQSQGCAISKAATSMLTEYILGKTTKELDQMTQEDILKMIGIPLSAVRIKCGLLGFYVLKKALTLLKLQNA